VAAAQDARSVGRASTRAADTAGEGTVRHGRLRLAAASFLMLFVELALIRWTAANNIHLAYLTNFVLLSSFLGIGIGFLRAHRGPDLFRWTPVALALLVTSGLLFPVHVRLEDGSLYGAFHHQAAPRWVTLSLTFLLTVAVMAGIGQAVARLFVRYTPLEAYRLDILGSIAGIVAFSVLAFLQLPPIAWGVIACALLAVLIGRRWQLVALIAVLALLAVESANRNDHWSPYYKVTAVYDRGPLTVPNTHVRTHGVLTISANNIPHQTAYPVATLKKIERFYFFPYRHLRAPPNNVLIVGAGNGNDVSVALSEGARHVDAVEIDPAIQSLGAKYHPNDPWHDPRVTRHINDGRAFVENVKKRYDLILFALPDSLTLVSGQGALRLENYLFTKQSMETVRRRLKPGGTFAMYNYYEPFLLDRYAGTLADVYGHAPCVELGDSLAARRQAVITAGAGASVDCRTPWRPVKVSEPTDNYPFPYLQHRAISPLYWRTLVLLLAASVVLIAVAGGSGTLRMGRYADLAFMGAAFLLLETKNVVQFALLFGTTWFVNSLVFAGVLLSVYLAVETARHVRLPPPSVLYLLLLASLAVAWLVPPGSLLALSPVPRFFAAVATAFAPIFLANLVFAQRFRDVAASNVAFAANLLGAIAGGALEYLSLVTGYSFLLVVVAALYAAAFFLDARRRRVAPASVPAVAG
jgi:hypothetical protein